MISHFIETCRHSGIDFSIGNAGKLKINADRSALTPEVMNQIKVAKSDIVTFLRVEKVRKLDSDFQRSIPNRSDILTRLNLKEDDIEGFYPLVPLQEGMLLQHMLNEQNDTYIKYFIIEIKGQQVFDKVLSSFMSVAQRHASCRTSIVWRGVERAYQLVKKQASIPVVYVHCANKDEYDKELQALKSKGRVMDLERDSLMRIHAMVREDIDEWGLFIERHHIVSDQISLEVTLFELLKFYKEEQSQLPPAKQQYEFALKLNEQGIDDTEYFDELLAEFDAPSLLFNVNHTHVDPMDILDCSYEHEIDDELQGAIRYEAKRLGVSSSVIFHFAWVVVMAKFCDTKDVLFPTVMSGRMTLPEYRTTIGMFLNSLPFRVKLDGRSISEQLHDINLQILKAYQHERIPLEKSLQTLTDEFGTAFNCVFNYRHSGEEEILEELPFTPVLARDKPSTPFFISVTEMSHQFHIELSVYKGTNGLALIDGLELALRHVVNALADDSKSSFSIPTLLPEEKVRDLTAMANGVQVEYSSDLGIHQLFEKQVANNPNSVALVLEGKQLTYRQLDEQANCVAHYLKDNHDVKPDMLVGLCVERSFEMVIGILGILKAGGCYVPFDIEHGVEIIHARINSHNVKVTLFSDKTQASFENSKTLSLNINSILASNSSTGSKGNLSVPFSLAYAMSSSGTTGKPKLIGLAHKALVNLVNGLIHGNSAIDGQHRVLQFSSSGFDMSFTDIALALLQGGSLYLIEERHRFDVSTLIELIIENEISLLNLPSSMLKVLSEVCVERQILLPSVRVVLSTAEKLEVSGELKAFFTLNKNARLANHFGPTETHVCTTYNFEKAPESWPSEVPIGHPIANTQCYVLDSEQSLLPKGVVGELYVGGDCLAEGYLGNAALTEEKFRQVEIPGNGIIRLYRTGDLVKWENDQLMCLGRADDQIKVHGYRVELDDVQQQIKMHPDIDNAVTVYDGKLNHIIGYFTSDTLDDTQLRQHLMEQMPAYMVPRFLVKVDEFQLTINGKINKSALPTIEDVYSQREYIAPETETEKTLIEQVAKVIDVDPEQLSVGESFLNLGGNSILSIRLSQSLVSLFSIQVPLSVILESNNIKELALELDLILNMRKAPEIKDVVEEEW